MSQLSDNLPRLSQRDPKWSSLKLGNSGLTVGDWGCTFIASCIAAKAFGKTVDPMRALSSMNSIPGGFEPNGSLNWQPMAKVLGIDHGYRWDTNANVQPNHSLVYEPAAIAHIEWLASVGIPTVCWVDTDHDAKPNHFVCYVGEQKCIDPWDGQLKSMISVFKRLYGYEIFTGDAIYGTKITALVTKANEIKFGRNVDLNAREIMDVVLRP